MQSGNGLSQLATTSLSKRTKYFFTTLCRNREYGKKKALIEKLSAIDENMDTEEASNLVRDLMKEWNSIGHVPFKEKDKLYKQYHGLIDQLFDRFNINASNKKLSNFRSNISNIQGAALNLYIENARNWYVLMRI